MSELESPRVFYRCSFDTQTLDCLQDGRAGAGGGVKSIGGLALG